MAVNDFFVEEVMRLEEAPGEYLYVKITKENRNTLDVLKVLAQQLRVPMNYIGFAGTKDKNATTIQYVSVYKGNPEQVQRVQIYGVVLEPLFFGKRPLVLGMLEGNRFRIQKELARVETPKWMVNYFGPQRFSTDNVLVGKAILKGEWEKACMLIKRAEVMDALAAYPKNYVGALQKVNKRLLSLYVNAVQSFLWNKVAAAYVRTKYTNTVENQGLVFVREGTEEKNIPLVAFDAVFDDPFIEKMYADVLVMEGLTLRDFIVRSFPDIMPVATDRPLFVPVKEFTYEKGWCLFFLPKGSYATILLQQLESFL